MDLSSLASMQCTIDDGLARVVLNQPERGNPIDAVFCRELRDVATELSGRDDVRAVLLTARGRFFSVGGDIKSFAVAREGIPPIVRNWTADLHSAIARFMRMRAPVVAAVHGNVAGGSVSLVASADIIYAADTISFTAAFPMIGFSADSGSTVTLSQRMGFSRAKRFLLMSETLKAKDAHEAGLVDFLTTGDALLAEAEATAKKFAAGPTRAYGGIKETMLRARTQGLETQMEDEAQTLAAISYSDDSWEGLSAFLEKRPPNFRGR
jgi:2-(1,2-epoxy-1,2-dihydrophenyl)acetyl-CoA isomerase